MVRASEATVKGDPSPGACPGLAQTHLGVEPGLQVSAVIFHQGLILASDLIQDLVEIHWRGSIHLHIQPVPKLASKFVDFLQKGGKMALRL